MQVTIIIGTWNFKINTLFLVVGKFGTYMIKVRFFNTVGRRGGPAEDRGHHGGAARGVEEGEGEADQRRHGLPEETDGERRQQVGHSFCFV